MLGTITRGEVHYDPLPDNVYLAKLTGVKEKAPPEKHPEWFPSLSWAFQLVLDPFKNRKVWGKTPSNWVAGKKLDTWLQALGIHAANGQSVRIEDLKDIYVKVIVKTEHYQDKDTKEDKTFTSVKELLPLDSVDQLKVRELVAGVVSTPAPVQNPSPAPVYAPTVPTFTEPKTQTGGYVPVTTGAPVSPTPSAPVTGMPTRTIPF